MFRRKNQRDFRPAQEVQLSSAKKTKNLKGVVFSDKNIDSRGQKL